MARSNPTHRKALALLLIVTHELMPVSIAYAQTVPVLQDQPLFTVSTVQPNLMLTLDNSGSMAWQFAPMSTSSKQGSNCFQNANYNRLYYNPNVTYIAPIKPDGTRYADASYTAAWRDGFNTGAGTLNLSTSFPAVGNYASST